MASPDSRNAEAWLLAAVAVLVLVGGAAGIAIWARTVSARMTQEAEMAAAAASQEVVRQMRDAEREARAAEPGPGPAAVPAPGSGGALERSRILRAAIDAADTPDRKRELRGLLDRAAVEVEAGRADDSVLAVAALRVTIGDGYSALGEHALALRHLSEALRMRREALGERHPDTIRAEMAVEDAEKAAAGAR